jgi:hypothetical protein
MLGHSQRKTMAIDMLESDGPPAKPRTHDRTQAIHAAEQRIATMTQEREGTGLWQRARRKKLDQLIDRQHEAIDRWSAADSLEPPRPLTPDEVGRDTPVGLDHDDIRRAVIAPPRALVGQIGMRPECLAEREQWCRAVARLVGDPVPTADPTDMGLNMHDTGMEL